MQYLSRQSLAVETSVTGLGRLLDMVERGIIAIVDDDEAVRRALAFLLETFGRLSESFPSADAFLAADPARFAGLILDHHMPAMTGLELARHMESMSLDIPVLLTTGDLTARIEAQARELGITVLEKPPPMEALSGFLWHCREAHERRGAA